MHGYGFNFSKLTEFIQVAAKFGVGFIHISLAGVHGFVVITNFMTHISNLSDDSLIVALGNHAEVIGSGNAEC